MTTKIKRWLANKLIALARRIDPPNPEYMKFLMDQMLELAITGRSNVKITYVPEDQIFKQGEQHGK